MNHILITDDKFFQIYQILGFNVKITEEKEVCSIIEKGNFQLIFITEGFYKKVHNELKKYSDIPIIPIPDLKYNGELAKDSIDNMLKRFLGGIK